MEIKIGMITAVHADELKFLGVPAVWPTSDHAAQDYRPPQRGLVDVLHGHPSLTWVSGRCALASGCTSGTATGQPSRRRVDEP